VKLDVSIELTREQIKSITNQVRMSGGADSRFDINLLEGKVSESELSDILRTVEVKKDYKTHKTGNIAVEFESRGKPSGIATTEAEWWAFVLVNKDFDNTMIMLFKTGNLMKACRKYINTNRDVYGGDDDTSRMILLPLQDTLTLLGAP
jgi:hypothetical protein